MSEMAPEPGPITKVAQNLSEILRLYDDLADQAINDSASPLMPGGRAMVELGPVANFERWEHMTDAGERLGRVFTLPDLEDDDDAWSAFQRIEYWSERWRRELGAEYDGQQPTIATEANFVRHCLDWAWDNLEPAEWDAFAESIRTAKTRLEEILTDGRRAIRGVKCFDCNVDLIRPAHDPREPGYCEGTDDAVCLLPHKRCPHDRGGYTDEYKCPSCDRRYSREDYALAIQHAHFVYADYLTLDDAAARTGVKPGTIKVWATRGLVKRHKAPGAERVTYCVADIEARSVGAEA